MIQAKVVADSLNPYGCRLTTLLVVMPRYILAEFNTHRMLSKNSASSRAIPFDNMLKMVSENPFIPLAWQKEHKGMQGSEYLDDEKSSNAASNWQKAAIQACETAATLHNNYYGDPDSLVTKQLCNRLLEPFMYHTVLVSGTEWENFFALRCPQYQFMGSKDAKLDGSGWWDELHRSKKDFMISALQKGFTRTDWNFMSLNKGQADIHMMATAEAIWDAMGESNPKLLEADQWHIPFGDDIDEQIIKDVLISNPMFESKGNSGPMDMIDYAKICIATARAARTSYTTVDSQDLPNSVEQYKKDIELHDRLSKSGHWSPFEHCAKAMTQQEMFVVCRTQGVSYANHKEDTIEHGMFGNFRGFIQYRKMFNNENIK